MLFRSQDPDLWKKILKKAETLLKSPESMQSTLKTGYNEQLKRAQNNKTLLNEFLKKFLKREAIS